MKKWILILGLVVLAVSAIAASRIRNTGIYLDDYFYANRTQVWYEGPFVSRGSYTANVDSAGSNGSLASLRAERGSSNELSAFVGGSYDNIASYSDFSVKSEDASYGSTLYMEWGSNENSDYADATLKVRQNSQEFYITNISGDYIFRVSNTQAPTSSLLEGDGNAYACLDSSGKLYRSATACA